MTRLSPLFSHMCSFRLVDGSIHNEKDYADPDGKNGWRNFPYKAKVEQVRLFNRNIDIETVKIPKNMFKGFALHYVSAATLGFKPVYVGREIMLVQNNLKVFVCAFSFKRKKWHDYVDDLKQPDMPHLQQYNLSIHGM